MIDGGLDAREAVMGTGRIDTKGPGSGQLHRDRHRGKQSHCRNQGKSSKFHVASLSVGSWNRTGPVQSNRWDEQKQGVRLSGTSICPKRLLSRVLADCDSHTPFATNDNAARCLGGLPFVVIAAKAGAR